MRLLSQSQTRIKALAASPENPDTKPTYIANQRTGQPKHPLYILRRIPSDTMATVQLAEVPRDIRSTLMDNVYVSAVHSSEGRGLCTGDG